MRYKWFIIFGVITLVFGAYLAFTTIDSDTSVVIAAKKTYLGTIYVAGHGGHFAKADVTIDPNNEDDPIKINNLDRVIIGTGITHQTHDARIDNTDNTILFWSTYKLDDKGKQHVGKSDLKTGKKIIDLAMDPDPRSPGKTGPLYCASGQSEKYFMPIFMGIEAYIDVYDKKTMDWKHRVFISDIGYKKGTYQFLHGTNSYDNKKFILTMAMKGEDGEMNGKIDFVMVDIPSLEKGKLNVLAKKTLTGIPGKTITFRQYFSKDGKLIFQSSADRAWVLDAATLELVDEKMLGTYGQNHDFISTPDDKYGILTLRTVTPAIGPDGKAIPDKNITDGTIMVYDLTAKKLLGKPISVCLACHKDMGLGDKNAILCGLDANWKE